VSRVLETGADETLPDEPGLSCLHVGKYFPPYPGGIENYLRDLLDALAERGVRCSALVHRKRGAERARGNRTRSRGPAIAYAGVWFTLAFVPLAPAFPILLWRLIKHKKPGLLHLHLPNVSAFWALLLPNARRLPWVVHWHADVPLSEHKWQLRFLYRFYRPLEQQLLSRADVIVVTSPRYLVSSCPLAPWRAKCAVIPLGINAPPRSPETVQAAGRGSEHLRVLGLGRLSYYKGFDVLIRAVAETPAVILDLVGDGEERGRLQDLVRKLGVQDRVTLHGQLSDKERQTRLAACDCLCLPSVERSEAFGVVLLEAMAEGKPCVTTSVPGTGMGWVVQDGITGFVVAPGDPVALAGALQRLADAPGLRKTLGKAGRARFLDCFRIERSADQVLQLYRRVLSDRGSAPVEPPIDQHSGSAVQGRSKRSDSLS
jgi:rhamnosyl/mannosyltransferase